MARPRQKFFFCWRPTLLSPYFNNTGLSSIDICATGQCLLPLVLLPTWPNFRNMPSTLINPKHGEILFFDLSKKPGEPLYRYHLDGVIEKLAELKPGAALTYHHTKGSKQTIAEYIAQQSYRLGKKFRYAKLPERGGRSFKVWVECDEIPSDAP